MSKPVVDKKFIVQLQGKDFVTYEGLLDLAHQSGLKSIEVEVLQLPNNENGSTAICMATAKTENAIYTDVGDASPRSVANNLVPHILRMASTRAKARALRDLTNVGMTAVEEMGGDSEGSKPSKPNKPASNLPTADQLEENKKLALQIVVDFGKHNGKTLKDVTIEDPSYVEWLADKAKSQVMKNAAGIMLQSDLYKGAIKRQGV